MSHKQDSICVADFCGSYSVAGFSIYPFQYWADWFPDEDERVTRFGGRWSHVPDMPGSHQPTEPELDAWAKQHGGFYFTPEERGVLGIICRTGDE